MSIPYTRSVLVLAPLLSFHLLAPSTASAFNFDEHRNISCEAVRRVCQSFPQNKQAVPESQIRSQKTGTSDGDETTPDPPQTCESRGSALDYAREFLCNRLCDAGASDVIHLIPQDGVPTGLACGGYGDVAGLVDYYETPLELMTADCYHMRQAKSDFVRMALLAHKNDAHFGKKAEESYRLWQKMAITTAAAASTRKMPSRNGEQWLKRLVKEAIIYSAFAAHFLEDRHSAGHIRVPRGEVSDDVAQKIHDNDSEDGLCLSPIGQDADSDACKKPIYGDGHLYTSKAHDQRATLLSAVVTHLEVLVKALESDTEGEPEIYRAMETAPFFQDVSHSAPPVGRYHDRAGYPSLGIRYSNYRANHAFNYAFGVFAEIPLLQVLSITGSYLVADYWKGTQIVQAETGEPTLGGTNGWRMANAFNLGARLYWRDFVMRSFDLFLDVSETFRVDLFRSWSRGYGDLPPDIMAGFRLRLWRIPISIQFGYPSRPPPHGAPNRLVRTLSLDATAAISF